MYICSNFIIIRCLYHFVQFIWRNGVNKGLILPSDIVNAGVTEAVTLVRKITQSISYFHKTVLNINKKYKCIPMYG